MATSTTTMDPAPEPRFLGIPLPEALSVLREPDYRTVWTGNAISLIGTWMQVVAQGLLVLELWDSELALGTMNFANALPSLIIMLFGGVLADRGDKRKILILTQVFMALLAAVVGVLILTDTVEFWMILVATVMLGIAFGYDMPAYQAMMPELVPPEKISNVVALNSSTFHGSRMIGPAIAGGVIGGFGLAAAYFINAASFIAVVLSLMIIRYRSAPRADGPQISSIEGLKAGFRHARGRPNLMVLLALTALNTTFIFPTMAVLAPAYVTNVLDEGSAALGLLFAMSGLGSLFGALILVWWPVQARKERIWLGALGAPVALTIMAVSRDPVISIITAGFLSLAFSMQLGVVQQMIQESTPRDYRGRVMSLHGITFNGTMPVAALGSSVLAVAIGLPAVMVLSAGAYLAVAFFMLRIPAGGIGEVVRASQSEFEIVAASGG
jgi:MFS family permease